MLPIFANLCSVFCVLTLGVIIVHGSTLNSKKQIDDNANNFENLRAKRLVEITENQINIPDQSCIRPDGKSGHCKLLRYCPQDEFKEDALVVMDYLCVIPPSSVGVCCPDTQTLAGDLPATAPREEEGEAITRIRTAENRGCGMSTRAHSRLVGARPTTAREWPWMASVTPEGFLQYCGGVLITDRHVLTAAHCTRRWKADELLVRLGEYDFDRNDDTRSYNFRVVEIRQHENFDYTNYHHDIAILKMHRPATFNSYVWPICLPPPGLDLVNETTYIIGWGTQFFGGPSSHVLMEVPVPVWDQQDCISNFVDSIFNETICAGGYEGGKDACQGDSGGPLMYQLPSGRWTVIGIVSWGIQCGQPNHPGLYARVDKYLSWIVQNARF